MDFLQEFLDALESSANIERLSNKIEPLCCSTDSLPFDDEVFDVIWSGGAIYNISFEKGVMNWRRYLKPGGLLVASEISRITNTRPADIQKHWESEMVIVLKHAQLLTQRTEKYSCMRTISLITTTVYTSPENWARKSMTTASPSPRQFRCALFSTDDAGR